MPRGRGLQNDGVVIAGAVLCGGTSHRMGSDKAALMYEGERLVERGARRIEAAGFTPVFVAPGRVGRLGPLPWTEVEDALPGAGPLGGLVAVLEAAAVAEADLVAVVAVDMVAFDVALLSSLASSRESEEAIVPLDDEGRPQPLHAIYATTAARALRAALESGERSLRDGLAHLDVRYITPVTAAPGWSRNLNRPTDLTH
jgi:molybdopterin-guanine dinucleotide biosynthesis protein A